MAQDRKMLAGGVFVGTCALLALLLVDVFAQPEKAERVNRRRGVLVASVREGSTLHLAGLRSGDVLVGWKGPSEPPTASPLQNQGSIFDWYLFVLDQVPRGRLDLVVRREGEEVTLEGVSLERLNAKDFWLGSFSPVTSETTLRRVEESRRLFETGDLASAATELERPGPQDPSEGRDVECWLQLRRASLRLAAGEPGKALELLEAARTAAPGPVARWAVLRLTSKLHRVVGDLEASEAALVEALGLQESTWRDGVHLAGTLGRIGLVSWYRSDLERAETYLRAAERNARMFAPGSIPHAAWVGNLGLVLEARGDLAAAIEHQEKALGIQRSRTPDHANIARGMVNLGYIDLRRGNLARAAERFRSALETARRLGPDSELEAACLGNLGSVELARGDLDLATEYSRQSLQLWRKVAPGGRDEALSLHRLGEVYRRRGDLEGAEDSFRQALHIHGALAPTSIEVAEALEGLGSVARDRGDPAAARDFFSRALEIWRQIAPGNLAVAVSWNRLGLLAEEGGHAEMAESHYGKALQIFEKLGVQNIDRTETLFGLGSVARVQGDVETALSYWARGLEVLEEQMRLLGGPSYLKASYRHQFRSVYRSLIELLLELGHAREAFEALERSRAIEFLRLLQQKDLDFPEPVAEPVLRKQRRLAESYDQVLRRLATTDPEREADRLAELRSQLGMTWRELKRAGAEIRTQAPDFAARRSPRPYALSAVRGTLDPGTVLLSYSVGDERTVLFAVTPEDGLLVETLPVGAEELRHRITDFREVILRALPGDRTGARRSLESLGRDLYRLLLAPVEELVARGERVLVLPDGALHVLPWAALVRDSGRYLVEWKPVHTALSATVYAELKRDRPRHEEAVSDRLRLAAFGDPRYSDQIEEGGTSPVADVHVRAAVERRLFDWQRLPHSRDEVKSVASLYPSGEVQTFLGAEATEEAVKLLGGTGGGAPGDAGNGGPRIVHFAAHGHLDDRFPLNSALVLSIPEELEEGRDNGLLQVWEIFERLRLESELVVLSACSSALGEELGGEGLIGLTRAFQYAGARSVAASLWSVRDEATAELMVRFHRHLRAGLPKDQALRAAQMELLRGPVEGKDLSAPFYWAAFQIYGDWK